MFVGRGGWRWDRHWGKKFKMLGNKKGGGEGKNKTKT